MLHTYHLLGRGHTDAIVASDKAGLAKGLRDEGGVNKELMHTVLGPRGVQIWLGNHTP
jgi:hypothetical protein